ncbi:MAG: hypothetical protein JWO98_2238 [Frankiales bacterium]|nr:hypothetical protein [Frankiales bacterium]
MSSLDRTDRNFPLYWMTGPCAIPRKLGDVLIFALRKSLITNDDLFDRTDDWMADAARLSQLFEERGAWTAIREELASHAFASQCPFWCNGDHPQMGNGGVHCDPIFHKLPVSGFHKDGRDIQTVIYAWQDEDGLGELDIIETGLLPDEELTGEELVHLAEGHLAATQLLEKIKRMSRAR